MTNDRVRTSVILQARQNAGAGKLEFVSSKASKQRCAFMPSKPRMTGTRFKVADIVEVSSFTHPELSGLRARVIEVRESRYSQTLDKYVVMIEPSSDRKMFWDIELKA
jgi:hypothetical protein